MLCIPIPKYYTKVYLLWYIDTHIHTWICMYIFMPAFVLLRQWTSFIFTMWGRKRKWFKLTTTIMIKTVWLVLCESLTRTAFCMPSFETFLSALPHSPIVIIIVMHVHHIFYNSFNDRLGHYGSLWILYSLSFVDVDIFTHQVRVSLKIGEKEKCTKNMHTR